MGQSKQLLPWKRGTLLSHAIEKSLQLKQLNTFVILGAHFQTIKKEITHFPITIVQNKDWESGMGTSIRSAITYFSENSLHFKAVLITLVDQPLIDVVYSFFGELAGLTEDYGARYILRKHKHIVIPIEGEDKVEDIDTIEQYQSLLDREKGQEKHSDI